MPLDALTQLGLRESELDIISKTLQSDSETLDELAVRLGRPRSTVHHAAVVVAREILGEPLGLVAPRFVESARPLLEEREQRMRVMYARQSIIKALRAIREDLSLYEAELEQKERLKAFG